MRLCVIASSRPLHLKLDSYNRYIYLFDSSYGMIIFTSICFIHAYWQIWLQEEIKDIRSPVEEAFFNTASGIFDI